MGADTVGFDGWSLCRPDEAFHDISGLRLRFINVLISNS